MSRRQIPDAYAMGGQLVERARAAPDVRLGVVELVDPGVRRELRALDHWESGMSCTRILRGRIVVLDRGPDQGCSSCRLDFYGDARRPLDEGELRFSALLDVVQVQEDREQPRAFLDVLTKPGIVIVMMLAVELTGIFSPTYR